MTSPTLPAPRSLLLGGAAGLAVGLALWALGLPSPTLFGGLAGGAVAAFGEPRQPRVPATAVALAQAVLGVSIGEAVTVPALHQIAADWPTVLLVVLVTLLLSLASGVVLARLHPISLATGVFSMAAGGASGITTIADELGADARVVSVLQYLRVLLVLVSLPLVVGVVFHPARTGSPAATAAPPTDLAASLVLVLVSCAAGLLLARLLPVSTFTLLGPLAAAAGLTLWGGLGPARTPAPLLALAMTVIGLQVGVKFTRSSLAAIGRLLPTALALILAVMAACATLGLTLSRATGVDPLTTYLATTPGGLFAVLATARDSGAEPTYVFAVQLARLLAILATAPLLARWLAGRGEPATRA